MSLQPGQSSSKTEESKGTVYVAMAANIVITLTKFAVAIISGSSAMFSEGIHSAVDTSNEVLLLLGIRLSKEPADDLHPFGHGQEIYFWGLMVAILLFGLGGGMSILQGIAHLQHPAELGDPLWNYVVLAIALVADGTSWIVGLRTFLRSKRRNQSWWSAVQSINDPSIYVVLGEDTADLLGITIAFLGIFLSRQLNNPAWDAIASILIGGILALVSVFLVRESKGLLVGERIDEEIVEDIRRIAETDPAVVRAQQPLTMVLSPSQLLVILSAEFQPQLSVTELIAAMERLQNAIHNKYADIEHVYIEPTAISRQIKGANKNAP